MYRPPVTIVEEERSCSRMRNVTVVRQDQWRERRPAGAAKCTRFFLDGCKAMCVREKMARSRVGMTGATVKSEPNLKSNNAWGLKAQRGARSTGYAWQELPGERANAGERPSQKSDVFINDSQRNRLEAAGRDPEPIARWKHIGKEKPKTRSRLRSSTRQQIQHEKQLQRNRRPRSPRVARPKRAA